MPDHMANDSPDARFPRGNSDCLTDYARCNGYLFEQAMEPRIRHHLLKHSPRLFASKIDSNIDRGRMGASLPMSVINEVTTPGSPIPTHATTLAVVFR
jgi:hypothetical protein